MSEHPFDLHEFYQEVDRRYRHTSGDDVEVFLEDALCRARLSGDSDAIIAVASELGSVLRVRGEFTRAEQLYTKALRRLVTSPTASRLSQVNVRINLGDVYEAWGRFDEAIRIFDEAEALLDCPESYPYQVSALCNNRSSAYREMGRLADARRDLKKAHKLLEHVENSAGERAVNEINLAQILLMEGRLDEAQRTIEGALEAYKTLSGGRDIHKPNAYAVLGQILYLKGAYADASAAYGQAIAALTDKLGSSHTVEVLQREKDRIDKLAASS